MPCRPWISSDGSVIGIACSRGRQKQQRCYICGKPSTQLCDHPGCDKPMCKGHSHNIGPDNDVCDKHYSEVGVKQAQANRKKLEDQGWEIKEYICPTCKNSEHSQNARFCKICGQKINR